MYCCIFSLSGNLPFSKELLIISVTIGVKSSRCSFMRLVGTGSKTQLLVANFLTIHSTSLPDNMLDSVNLYSV